MTGKRRSIEEKVRIPRKADGAQTFLQVCDEAKGNDQASFAEINHAPGLPPGNEYSEAFLLTGTLFYLRFPET